MSWQQTMMDAISEVLETMFFVCMDSGEAPLAEGTSCCGATIRLRNGPGEVTISFCLTEPFARTISGNFLGKNEEAVSGAELEDVVKELANMVAGNYVGRSKGHHWGLGIPSYTPSARLPAHATPGLPLHHFGTCVGTVLLEELGN